LPPSIIDHEHPFLSESTCQKISIAEYNFCQKIHHSPAIIVFSKVHRGLKLKVMTPLNSGWHTVCFKLVQINPLESNETISGE